MAFSPATKRMMMQMETISSATRRTSQQSPSIRTTATRWQSAGGNSTAFYPTFGKPAGGYTTDAGITWNFPGVLEDNVFRSDPVLYSDEIGKFFYLSQLETFCDDIWGSSNGAQSWTRLPLSDGGGVWRRQGVVHDR